MALSSNDPRITGWVGIAPPHCAFGSRTHTVAADPRPKHLVLAQHDEFRPPDAVVAEVASWVSTTTEIVAGASHFFVGRTDQVVAATVTFLDSGSSSGS